MDRLAEIVWFFRKPYDFHFSIEKIFNGLYPSISKQYTIKKELAKTYSGGILPRLRSILAVKHQKGKVNHVTGDVHYLVFGLPGKSTILTIHDLGMMNHPNYILRFFLWIFWVWLPVRIARYITTISEETRQDIIKYTRCPESKITVIPNYVDPNFKPVNKTFNNRCPIILHIGTAPNKNLIRTIEAIKRIECEFWVVGKLDNRERSMLSGLSYKAYHGISDEQLKVLYEKCDLLSFCSTLEGFGLPILEAQAIGRPVVTSDLSSMPEVGGEGACYVDPYNTESIRDGIQKVITDKKYRENLVLEGFKNVEKYQIEAVAESYINLYKRALKENGKS